MQLISKKKKILNIFYVIFVVFKISTITILFRYCKNLPCDGFSSPAPRWSFKKKEGGVVCAIQLPIQSGIRTVIEVSTYLFIIEHLS